MESDLIDLEEKDIIPETKLKSDHQRLLIGRVMVPPYVEEV